MRFWALINVFVASCFNLFGSRLNQPAIVRYWSTYWLHAINADHLHIRTTRRRRRKKRKKKAWLASLVTMTVNTIDFLLHFRAAISATLWLDWFCHVDQSNGIVMIRIRSSNSESRSIAESSNNAYRKQKKRKEVAKRTHTHTSRL